MFDKFLSREREFESEGLTREECVETREVAQVERDLLHGSLLSMALERSNARVAQIGSRL
jgi:hypothetical protein